MRMFLSISGHSSEFTADSIAAKMCLRPHAEDKNLHRHLRSFPIQNSNQMASRLSVTTSFSRVFFQLLQVSRQRLRPSFSAPRVALMTKTDFSNCYDRYIPIQLRNRFYVAVRLFSNRSQMTSKCGKNISDTLGYTSCATFLFLPHFYVICDLLLNRRTETWNLFVNCTGMYRSYVTVRKMVTKLNKNDLLRLF